MNRHVLWLTLVLSLAPCAAWSKDICIEIETTGDVVIMNGVARGAKPVSGYFAVFKGINAASKPIFHFRPMSGSALLSSTGTLSAGLTEVFMEMNETGTVNFFSDQVTFHRISCTPGGNDKLEVLDGCTDIMQIHKVGSAPFSLSPLGHIIPCHVVPGIP